MMDVPGNLRRMVAKAEAERLDLVSLMAMLSCESFWERLLIPPFVTESTGNAADAGIVMAIISLAAILAPVLGGFADKYRAHRLVLTLGVLGMALGFLMYSFSADAKAIYALDAIVLGISAAAINAGGPPKITLTGRGCCMPAAW